MEIYAVIVNYERKKLLSRRFSKDRGLFLRRGSKNDSGFVSSGPNLTTSICHNVCRRDWAKLESKSKSSDFFQRQGNSSSVY